MPRADVRAALAASPVDLSRTQSVVGVAATVLTITAHALRMDSLDRARLSGTALPIERLQTACAELSALAPAQLAALPYVRAGREDVLVAGALIWSEVLTAVTNATTANPVTAATASLHDILDGVALELGTGG